MKASEIRSSFLSHFESRGHRVVRSSSLIPAGDATLLFTNAGMNQFKDTFLGLEQRPYARAASVQKCLRVSGKHNDLEQVGRTARHQTFFEMLGNFSFGDYFKKDAIAFAWDFLTGTMHLPKDRLWVTIFREDDEAEALWRSEAGVDASRIVRLGEKDNFWSMGDTGPCGPCSEIHIDQGPNVGCGRATCALGCECDRYLEFWNLVFMQFNRQADGSMTKLARPAIDTGMGLERIAAITQGVTTNYRTDLFMPLLGAIAERAGVRYGASEPTDVSLQVIADHLRAITFLIADGIVPSNEKRGYVLRRVIRRALTFGKNLKVGLPFLDGLTGGVVDLMKIAYPELEEKRALIAATCRREEEAFEATLARGVDVADEVYRRHAGTEIPAGEAVRLYTTYGLSFEIQGALALPLGARMPVGDVLEAEMEKHREQARASWKGDAGRRLPQGIAALASTVRSRFVGYDTLRAPAARVVALFTAAGRAARLPEGESGFAVLDRTPFYAESGGQVGDTGRLSSQDGSEAEVEDTTYGAPGLVVHHVRVLQGTIEEGGDVEAAVNGDARAATMRNHTATHLLHASLKHVLGASVQQAGSYVGPDRLRFDFNYPGAVPSESLLTIEKQVNEQILLNTPVDKSEKPYDEAIREGAVALFGEKYGDRVRVVTVPGYSQELCGGTHCRGTGDIGQIFILSERGIAAGVRRIEALTGRGAFEHARRNEERLRAIERTFNLPRDEVTGEIATLRNENKTLKREIEKLRLKAAQAGPGGGAAAERAHEEIGGVKLVARRVADLDRAGLRTLADNLKRELGSGVVVLGSLDGEKVALLVAVTDDLASRLDARALMKEIAVLVGGGGGGRPTLAEVGGKHPAKLDEAIAASKGALARALGATQGAAP
ncbi:MAG: alanine--tRNA ligase [Acidobacteria bacterium]|nr:alanine--tRNA ligase [Acidobacteriota bacterium]